MLHSNLKCARNGFLSIGCVIIFILLTVPAHADEMTRAFLDGIKHYKENNFAGAISEFSKIADAGVKNSRLFYNLGNAYLRNNDLGHAILWYERALKLAPDDPDLRFNYEYALSQVKDERDDKDISVFRILFFWKHALSAETIRLTAIILNAVFWLAVILRLIQKKKKILRIPAYLILVPAVIFTLTAFYNYYEESHLRQAVILPPEVSVRSGLTDDSTELFILHAGTRVRIEKEKDEFFRIYFSEGKIGWIKKEAAGVI
jgi:tetratricopeptide (TPR) repeat protein